MPLSKYACRVQADSTLRLDNGRDSFQLFVGVFDRCLVWYLLVLPSDTHAVAIMTSLRAIDGNTSYHSSESFSLGELASSNWGMVT